MQANDVYGRQWSSHLCANASTTFRMRRVAVRQTCEIASNKARLHRRTVTWRLQPSGLWLTNKHGRRAMPTASENDLQNVAATSIRVWARSPHGPAAYPNP